jgi:hypothetical protein
MENQSVFYRVKWEAIAGLSRTFSDLRFNRIPMTALIEDQYLCKRKQKKTAKEP